MNSKTVLSVLFGVFVLLALTFSVSALQFSTPQKLSASNNQTTFALTNNVNETQNVTLVPSVTTSSGVVFAVSPTSVQNINYTGTSTITASVSSVPNDLKVGDHSAVLSAVGTNSSANVTLTYSKSFCESGNVGGNLSITKFTIENNGNGDDNSWILLDEVTVEVRVENEDTVKISDVNVVLGLIDSNGEDVANELTFISDGDEEYDAGDIKKDDSVLVEFVFTVPADFDTGSYKLVAKAYSSDLGENKECVDKEGSDAISESVDVDTEEDDDKMIAFTDNVIPLEATCGDEISLSTTLVNIGSSNQDEVIVTLYNKALGLNLVNNIKNGLDEGDEKEITFDFTVPSVKDGNYNLELTAEYDDGSSEDPTLVPLKLIGCSFVPGTDEFVALSASLASDAKSGSPLDVTVTITNTGDEKAAFILGVSGYESWATLDSISQRIVELEAGKSAQTTVSFDVDKAASGDKTFNLEVISGDQTENKAVSVNIAKASTGFGDLFSGNNSLIWIIAIINIVLIVVIIVVAIRVARR